MLCAAPSVAAAMGSASIGALLPSDTVGPGTQVTFTVLPSGFNNPTYTVVDSFGGGANNHNINIYGDFFWTPNNSDLGSHIITVTVSDSPDNSASVSQTINVAAPSITVGNLLPSATVHYGNIITFSISSAGFTSPQYAVADSFGYSSLGAANTDTGGNFHWTPNYQDIGTHNLVITAKDYLGHLTTSSQTITVTGPVMLSLGPVSPSTIVHAGDQISFTATTTGFTAPTYTVKDGFTSSLGTSTLAIDASGKITWTPNTNDIGVHTITVSASGASGDAATAQVLLQVVFGASSTAVPASMPAVAAAATANGAATVSAPYIFKTLLTVGSSGKDVTALQNLLLQLGLFSVSPSGYFGQVTKASLQKYQATHGIAPVGYAGPMTRASLNSGK
jgi:peptidoglycan hydrolase-like protein with peptidoglycan-binding domain